MIYLDNASTTRPSAACLEAVQKSLSERFGNPSSLYDLGFEAQKELERAREAIASALGCKSSQLVFTSGGTEANNMAVLGAARARKAWAKNIVSTGYEHPSVANCLKQLAREGFEVRLTAPGSGGLVSEEKLLAAVDEKTALVSAMSVNNETGARLDACALAKEVKIKNSRAAFHCDHVQGFLKEKLLISRDIDTLSLSAHKVHGPKGIGALYVRAGFNMENLCFGGSQERGVRPGTENAAYACGFAAAVKETASSRFDPRPLRDALKSGLEGFEGLHINSPESASPYIFNFSLEGLRSETLLRYLASRSVYVSSGSACAKGERSHTLTAMGLRDSLVDSALRVSFSSDNTLEDVSSLLEALKNAQRELLGTK
ncbi:MAG: cysteine desulfurase family protein [Oscillospiraceae bacterium]|nr:cysteine desulfurase family protein [Oscillospiraceae bacterium]